MNNAQIKAKELKNGNIVLFNEEWYSLVAKFPDDVEPNVDRYFFMNRSGGVYQTFLNGEHILTILTANTDKDGTKK